MKRVIIFSVIALLLSNVLITTAYANTTDTKDKTVTGKTDCENTLTQSLTLYKNGTIVAGPISVSNNSKILK